MLKTKTIRNIRKDASPLFLSVAASATEVSLSPFQDEDQGAFFLAQASEEDTAFSPLTGKKCEALQVGELAASKEEMKKYSTIGTCGNKKCKCVMYSSPAIASLLETAAEKTIYCTACGNEMTLQYDANDANIVDDAASDDDTSEDDETDDSVGDEDSEEDDTGDDSEDDAPVDDEEEDAKLDAEVASLMAELASEDDMSDDDTSDDEDEDDSSDEDDDSEDEDDDTNMDDAAENASEDDDKDGEKKPEGDKAPPANQPDPNPKPNNPDQTDGTGNVKPEGASADPTTLTYAMHKLADLSKGKTRILFLDANTAQLAHKDSDNEAERHLGTFSRDNASAESAKLFDNRSLFGKVVTQLVANGALAGEHPTDELAKMGFKAIMLQLPLDKAQASLAAKAVAEAKEEIQQKTDAAITDIKDNFNKLVAVAAVGMDKGVIGDKSFYKELATALHGFGIRNPGQVAKRFCEAKLKPFLTAAIEQAVELSKKEPAYVSGMAETISKATYASLDFDGATDVPSTIHQDDSNEEQPGDVVVAELDTASVKPLSQDKISGALRRIGRGGRF